jgi:hypothetical protein
MVKKRKNGKEQHTPKSLKTLVRSVGRKSCSSLARQALKDVKITKVLRTFSWESVVEELQVKAPTLLHLLKGCVVVKRSERPHKSSRKSHRSFRPTNTAILGTCAAILLRHKNQYMNLL